MDNYNGFQEERIAIGSVDVPLICEDLMSALWKTTMT